MDPQRTAQAPKRGEVIELLQKRAANTCEYLELLIESDMRHQPKGVLELPPRMQTEDEKDNGKDQNTATEDTKGYTNSETPLSESPRDPRLRKNQNRPQKGTKEPGKRAARGGRSTRDPRLQRRAMTSRTEAAKVAPGEPEPEGAFHKEYPDTKPVRGRRPEEWYTIHENPTM